MKENNIENLQNKKYFNNIDEAIKVYEEFRRFKNDGFIESIDTDFFFNLTDIILSDYKRVLKENEQLKQDRNNNYQMIALAQNEMLGYIQGYEDGKKLKKSAVAFAVENQEYYLIRKEIEHYKEHIEKLQKENEKIEEKDKIIQNMSKYILSLDIDKDICMKNTTNTELCNEDNSNCVECIIKHFSN